MAENFSQTKKELHWKIIIIFSLSLSKSIVQKSYSKMEKRLWLEFCAGHLNMHAAQSC